MCFKRAYFEVENNRFALSNMGMYMQKECIFVMLLPCLNYYCGLFNCYFL
ncbi:hypothetical protein HMPREF0653_01602 [Prevotella disiens JCM 6334 = ATCC 29426]|uniref:Uncharacterized protein n=1 Tax=Prevotella disiens JCM 6334 = ATCC 29426 TaxID=1235811 RepID=A0ABN0NRN9_9BACT|nr:hypothetical protein HMPREF0653_01602 [Prevotella disiens JCM 6334 = ATCC 29426]